MCTIKFSFQIVLPVSTLHSRWVVVGSLGDPCKGSRAREKTMEHKKPWHN